MKMNSPFQKNNFKTPRTIMLLLAIKKSSLVNILALLILFSWYTDVHAQSSNADNRGYEIVTPQDPSIPPAPTLRVVAGDGQVTLYWDDFAESFLDPHFQGTSRANRSNFEGYKIFKSTEPEFLDALRITDNLGDSLIGFRPIAEFDIANDIRGYHPAARQGVRYWLGNDTGIERIFVDNNVTNGRTYYYAVVAFTHGDALPNFTVPLVNPATGQIYDPPLQPTQVFLHTPRESLIDAKVNHETGEVLLGRNVVSVTPNAPVFGFRAPEPPTVERLSGSAGGSVRVDVIDPAEVRADHNYAITFQDTIVPGSSPLDPDLIFTTGFSLQNLTTGEFIFDRESRFRTEQLLIKEGLLLTITNSGDTVSVNRELSRWNTETGNIVHDFNFGLNTRFSKLADYRIEFSDDIVGRSEEYLLQIGTLSQLLPAEDVNFRVFNTTTNEEIPFAFFANPFIPRDLRSVYFADENNGWSVGGAGQLRRTIDGGSTWESLNTPTNRRLLSVKFIDAQTGWAVGNNGTILHTTNGGDTWADQSVEISTPIYDVHFKDASVGFAVSDAGRLYRTANAGEDWELVPIGLNRNLRAITFVNQDVGYAIGALSTVLQTTDGGVTWNLLPTAAFSGGSSADLQFRTLSSLYFADELNGWIVGNVGTIWTTTDGGNNWVRQSAPTNTVLNKVHFADTQTGWAVGPGGYIIKTSNGGATWATQNSTITTDLFGVFALDANRAVAVGQGPTLLNTSDSGELWSTITTPKRFRGYLEEVIVQGRQEFRTRSDEIFFIEDFSTETDVVTWKVSLTPDVRGDSQDPGAGDVLELVTIKPFTRADEYRFSIGPNNVPSASASIESDVLQDIRVVPNPYLVTHIGESRTYGPNEPQRQLHFTNLPSRATIRIFNVSGQLVQTLEVNNDLSVNRYVWNMQNQHGHMIPYGVYIYHVEAPGIGEHTGKFAVIK
ncbi:MAG: hypothetical protein LAT52_13000 [Balneolales bacterium]|nr:hypothetical protein [Balneolales bacterium]